MDAFYVSLDLPPENRRCQMQQLMTFCNETPNFDIIDPFCEKWEKVGACDRDRSEEIPSHMINPLKFAVEWYEHYSLRWGMYFRDSTNLLGDGD
jgi:hypothetical protein